MAEWRVSDEAFAEATKGQLLSREQYRRIKSMSRRELEIMIANVYRNGFDDCAEAMQKKAEEAAEAEETEEVKADWDDVLRVIGEVKGIGPKMLDAIDQKMKEVMG